MPASHEWLGVVSACIAEILALVEPLPERERVVYGVQLAVHETCTNIIDHAYAGGEGRIRAAMALHEAPRRLVVELVDSGRPFDIERVAEPNLDEPQVRGYGLFLIRKLVDEVVYVPMPSCNRWYLIKKL
jgi:serine/threonine-protein kinase RsbW